MLRQEDIEIKNKYFDSETETNDENKDINKW